MMKKILIICFGMVLLHSCQDLDLEPESVFSDGQLWQQEVDYERAVNLLYPSLGVHGFRDNDSDLAAGADNNAISNGSRTAPPTSNFFNDSYNSIRDANFVIDRAIANGFEDSRFVAEAKWFRALYYFRLIYVYGDVPFFTTVLDPGSEDLFAAKTSRETIVNFLLEDLRAIAPVLPLQSEIADAELGRISRGAADALRARIALFEGTWVKYHGTPGNTEALLGEAVEASQEVISSGEYELYVHAPDPDISYQAFYSEFGNDSKQQIVARRYDAQNTHFFSNGAVDGPGSPTRKLADMFLCTDGLPIDQSPLFQGRDLMADEFIDRDRRMTMNIVPPGFPSINRFDQEGVLEDFPTPASSRTYYRNYKFVSLIYSTATGDLQTFYYHLLHYPEILLTNAEALYELNGSITDNQLNSTINLLRARGGVAPLTNGLVSANGLDMLEEIRRERSIELIHEGFRRGDLRRWRTAEVQMPQALKGVQFVGTEFETAMLPEGGLRYPALPPFIDDATGDVIVEPESQRSFNPNRDYLDPFPTEEIIINPNLEQNPGW
ncbi:RagB/SusD family nutrient uptake outer membrane protein [Muricauda sp. SCSIO 64092]|uniref:RagB/SusD family nutrient uptake outer membrane protein n=1 Tax=Allomuricauda sp. SCSIO 64092 TaxID=2908842 RepID=UPI001FF123B3|nr:RagB/SusD family nutrient uptake outer membrane protein [Muricauda sp. SCSIO 64092]UOY04933.1 RagB/SusD family nutrient uptake outer membrane protein [Muricauda sp. SCSIO 64092]